ncbi:MAG: radical SAM protein [Pirellulales bacterium]|nr:radical SAM protein [Pirellulales bacterium]
MVTTGRTGRIARRLLDALRRDWLGWRAAAGRLLPVRPGLFAYDVYPPGGRRRIHLRIESDGSGVLLVDVTDAIHLNPTAALMARLALEKVPADRAAVVLRAHFRGVEPALLRRQSARIYALVEHLATTTAACSTCGRDELARTPLFSTPVRAPYKADLALTYGCNNACPHCYNQPQRAAMRSLSPRDWNRVLGKLARVGVPHVIFTGGEPTLFDDLTRLIDRARRLGLVAGLNTNGRRLADRPFVESLARAGLNHVQITLGSHRPEVHNAMTAADSFLETTGGIENSLAAGLHTITNTTLTRQNAGHAEQIVEFLHAQGLRTFAFNGMIYSGGGRTSREALAEADMAAVLVAVRDRAAELGMRFLWYTPTAYCRLSPVELELGPRRCNAAEYSVCIEPNGDVLPCQSYYSAAGNILRDRWATIWRSDLFRSFRHRVADPRGCGLPEACWQCPDLPLCAGGCRIEREHANCGIHGRENEAAPFSPADSPKLMAERPEATADDPLLTAQEGW